MGLDFKASLSFGVSGLSEWINQGGYVGTGHGGSGGMLADVAGFTSQLP